MNYDERTKVVVYLSPYQVEELKKMLTTSGFEHPDSAINYAVRTLVSDGIKNHHWISLPEK